MDTRTHGDPTIKSGCTRWVGSSSSPTIESDLADFSVSRSVKRAHGWGIPVPDDPGQVIYVWFDALADYLTGPGYGTEPKGHDR